MASCLFTALVCGSLLAGVSDEPCVLQSGRLSLVLDAHTGEWSELRWDDRSLSPRPGNRPAWNIKQADKWIGAARHTPAKLLSLKREGPTTAVAIVAVADWNVEVRYVLDAQRPLLTRTVRLTWKGKEPTKLKGFWLGAPPLAVEKEGGYFFPGVYPPSRRTAQDFQEGASRGTHQSLAPAIVELAPQLSALWLSDELTAGSDRGSTTIYEHSGNVEVSQAFSVAGHMRPGETQEIGAACVWLVDGDGEAALRQIHAWMTSRGHVVPADRPEWFRDAAIYSYHPGGTIGSGFRDLGGFGPATKLLDHIASLGVNTVWIMPIEDVAVYHPRDYYRFQEGLGTADEYRALVSRAHALKLHVLQDIVPHGGSNTYPRAKEHPEWLAYEEDGSTLSYWCFDFNWPTWREYMAGVARHYVTRFGVDGYRVDAVGGSRIPNWNAKIPYARASHAQLQGGLNMLHSLRSAVKESKPREGALLAEVQGSAYGTAADAIYDFTGCYSVFHDLRKLPAAEFVARLRRWLHEQQYAETADLLRLRHVESHDSLRSQLWYGIEPMRALFAMTAWIDGIPLVYHEMESGHEAVLRRILTARNEVPELRRGQPDYLSVQSPAGMFAWLRTTAAGAAMAFVNFDSQSVSGQLRVPLTALPESLRRAPHVGEFPCSSQTHCEPATVRDGFLSVPVHAGPFAFGVCVIRRTGAPLPVEPCSNPALTGNAPPLTVSNDAVLIEPPATPKLAGWRAWVNLHTGLLERFHAARQNELGPMDLYLPATYRDGACEATVRREGDNLVTQRTLGAARLEIQYTARSTGLGVQARWLGEVRPDAAAIYLPIPCTPVWTAYTAEGLLESKFQGRHLTTEGVLGSIYWRPQGTNVLWDSLFQPLSLNGGLDMSGAGLGLSFPAGRPPARAQWLDRVDDRPELGALLAWSDPAAPPGSTCRELALELRSPPPHATSVATAKGLRAAAGGWEYENDQYRLRLSRSGMIVQLWSKSKKDGPRLIVDQADLYTDQGFSGEKIRYGAMNEVEAAVRIDQHGDRVRMRCEGRLRGFGRFDLLKPPVEYFCEYVLDESASFRGSWGVRPQAAPAQRSAFLGLMLPVSGLGRFAFRHGERVLSEGPTGKSKGRLGQTGRLSPPRLPDGVELADAQQTLLRLTGLQCSEKTSPNVFVDGHNFFVAFYDGLQESPRETGWQWVSAMCTVGAGPPSAFGELPQIVDTAQGALLADPGFEQAAGTQSVSLRTGRPLPGVSTHSPWVPPPGGRLVSSPVHGGHSAAEVENSDGSYRLWHQPLPTTRFTAGSRWRLSAWVKGAAVQPGDTSWKVGVLRFAVATEKTQYVSCAPLKGDFDWRSVSVEFTVPSGLRSLRVEAGLNGATGRMWIDDVRLESQP